MPVMRESGSLAITRIAKGKSCDSLLAIHETAMRCQHALNMYSPAIRLPSEFRRFEMYKHLMDSVFTFLVLVSTYDVTLIENFRPLLTTVCPITALRTLQMSFWKFVFLFQASSVLLEAVSILKL